MNTITTNFGTPIDNTDNSLKAGERGPIIMDDFHFREKMTHFDHERIPERVVHARGTAAHGYFEAYEDLSDVTIADLFSKAGKKTPIFLRFSTVAGSKGSADTARDVRGFAVKFYTNEGNFDIVGNNIPVFFIQDAIKFPDIIHAAKPEPDTEVPQASTAHTNFWDFISLQSETSHMVMWVMSDRAIPRSLRMMQGFGVHTFVLTNKMKEYIREVSLHSKTWSSFTRLGSSSKDIWSRS
jgi:catalase